MLHNLLAALFAIFVAFHAHAETRVEALGGRCDYSEVGNGIWYNEKYEHTKDLTTGCALIGFSKVGTNEGSVAVGWRLSYVEMGYARMMGVYPVIDAEQALPAFDGKHCNPNTLSGCLARGHAKQRARGITLGYLAEWGSFGAEAGLYLYDGEFTVALAPEGGWPQPAWMDRPIRWRGTQLTPYAGITYRHGWLMATVRLYGNVRAAEHGCGGCSGLADGHLTQVLIGLSVPFK